MRRKEITIAVIAVILTIAVTAGFLLANFTGQEATVLANSAGEKEAASNLYTYPISPYHGNGKIYIVTVETNWTSQPRVSLPNEFDTLKYVSVVFAGWSRETVFFNVTIPTDLLCGNISLLRKYYEQPPDVYTLSNNGTHNSIGMTCVFTPYFSGTGYFAILGTKAAW